MTGHILAVHTGMGMHFPDGQFQITSAVIAFQHSDGFKAPVGHGECHLMSRLQLKDSDSDRKNAFFQIFREVPDLVPSRLCADHFPDLPVGMSDHGKGIIIHMFIELSCPFFQLIFRNMISPQILDRITEQLFMPVKEPLS